jgi:hypothetical protein
MSPQRIQRKRTKGWRMPEGAVYVGRPTVWGSPWTVRDAYWLPTDQRRGFAVRRFREEVGPCLLSDNDAADRLGYPIGTPVEQIIRVHLAGKDLACWCPLDQPCHADVLLEIANGDRP